MGRNLPKSTGYRLHKDRILFSGGEIVRTIKFPLIANNNISFSDILEKFKNKVIADDKIIRGDINLNDYLEYSHKNKKIYTLFDFWLDSLRAGVIWGDKGATLNSYKELFFPNNSLIKDKIWENACDEIKKFFDKDKFYDEFLTKEQLRSNTTIKSFRARLIKCLKEGLKNDDHSLNFIDNLVNKFFDSSGKLKLNTFQQNEVWKSLGLDKEIINQSKPQGEFKDTTFLIIPDLMIPDLENQNQKVTAEELINLRKNWLRNHKIESEDRCLMEILGLGGNFNGFFNYFNHILFSLKKENKIKEIADALFTYLPKDPKSEKKVLQSLNFLSEKAKLLPDVSMPISSWADYRSVFGGKIQSWFTNFVKRQTQLDEKISQFKSNLQEVKKYFESLNRDEVKEDIDNLKQLIDRLYSIEDADIKKEKEFEIFDSLVSSLRKRLNFLYQRYLYDEAKEGDSVKKHKNLGPIFKNIEKPIAFYGEAQRRKNKKFVEDTIPIIEEGTIFLLDLINDLQKTFSPESTFESDKREEETDEELFRRELQFILNKIRDSAINSSIFKDKYKEILQFVCKKPTAQEILNKENKGRYVFYKSKYAKGNVEEIELRESEKSYILRYKYFINFLISFLIQFDKDKLLRDKNLLLDWVELVKNVIANLTRFSTNKDFQVEKIKNVIQFKKAKNYLELFQLNKVSKAEFGFIIQSLILSEIKGAATLFSKQKYIASYTVQIVNSDEKFKLFYQPMDNQLEDDDKKKVTKKHRYLVAFDKVKKANDKSTAKKINLLGLEKNGSSSFSTTEEEVLNKTFTINSSFYQLQFLDKYLYKPQRWENINITLNEWSFIVEEAYNIKWDLEGKKPIFEKDLDSNRNKLYLAIPFTLKVQGKEPLLNKIVLKSKNTNDYSRDKNRLNYPILGIDVGEYGLAWFLVKFDFDKDFNINNIKDIQVLGRGFIEDSNIGKIKDYFAEIQQKSRLGAYEEDDTTIAKIRENAIGKLRNVIHSILTDNPDGASLIYEDAISNFETGSGKTTKIYNSVKRADTEFESEADKAEHNLVWGKKTRYIGRNISAYASSYLCVNCLKSIYLIKKDDLPNIKLEEQEGNILTFTTSFGKMKAYSKDKKEFFAGKTFPETEENLKSLRKILKDFTRPPLKNSEVIKKFVLDKNILTQKKLELFRKERGNSAIFVCPFCQFVADADIQAAFMMAMRGYLRFSGIVLSKSDSNSKGQEKTGDTFVEKTLEYLSGLKPEVKQKIINLVKI